MEGRENGVDGGGRMGIEEQGEMGVSGWDAGDGRMGEWG